MKKLLSITLTIAVFCMLSSTALAANWNQKQQQPQDELWQYIQTSDSFWNDIMQQVGISKPENNKPGNIPADKLNETPVIPPSAIISQMLNQSPHRNRNRRPIPILTTIITNQATNRNRTPTAVM